MNKTIYNLPDGSIATIEFNRGRGAAPDMFSLSATATTTLATGRIVSVTRHHSSPKQSLHDGSSEVGRLVTELRKAVIESPDGLLAEIAAEKAYHQLEEAT